MMTTMTLTEFLLARIADDEASATHSDVLNHAMRASWPGLPDGITLAEAERRTAAALTAVGIPDTDRLLAECEAKRRIIEMHRPGAPLVWDESKMACATCGDVVTVEWPCDTIIALAEIYAGHPDYD